MAAEPAAIRTTLTALGVDRQVTREAVTDLLGLSSVGAWVTAMGGDPEQLLDEKDADPDDPHYWSMSGDHYVDKAVQDVQKVLMGHGRELKANQSSPFDTGYRPELDVSPELEGDSFSYFQELIGILRWAVELGRADIALEVALLSRHLATPRRGHLEQCFNIFAFLKKHPRSKLVMDPTRMYLNEHYASAFPSSKSQKDWEEFYGDVKEEIPPAGLLRFSLAPRRARRSISG